MKFIYRGQNSESSYSRRPKWYIFVIILLTIALIISISTRFIGGGSFSEESVKQNIKNMLSTEIKNAISQAESLGRSGASGTTNTISRVRQHVYALQNLNSLNILLMGQKARVFSQQYLDTTMAAIDEFLVQLQTGQAVNEVLLKLMDNLQKLDSQLRLWK